MTGTRSPSQLTSWSQAEVFPFTCHLSIFNTVMMEVLGIQPGALVGQAACLLCPRGMLVLPEGSPS